MAEEDLVLDFAKDEGVLEENQIMWCWLSFCCFGI